MMPISYAIQATTQSMPNPFLTNAPNKKGRSQSHQDQAPQPRQENPFLTTKHNSHSSYNSQNSHNSHNYFNSFSAMTPPSASLPLPPQPPPSFDELFPSLNQTSKPQPQTPVPKLNFKSAVQHAQSNQTQTTQQSNQPHAPQQSNQTHAPQQSNQTQSGQYKNPFLHPINKFVQSGQFGPHRHGRYDNECEHDDVYDDAYDSAYTKYYDDQ